MSDQMEQQQDNHPENQPSRTSDPEGQSSPIVAAGPVPPAPAESFGSFGPPFADLPDGVYASQQGQPDLSLPQVPASAPAPDDNYTPALAPAAGYPYPLVYGYPAMQGVPPYGAPIPTKKPIYFPLTLQAPALLQIFGMLLYGLIVALGLMGCFLVLIKAYFASGSVYIKSDSSVNGLSILITFVLVLIVLPACSVLSGVFFGSWRGLLVSVLAVGGGILFTHLTENQFWSTPDLQAFLELAPLPISALVVGLIYDRRLYAAWWKSMLTLMLGVAIIVLWLAVFLYIMGATSPNLTETALTARMSTQSFLSTIGILLGCVSLVVIPMLGLFVAGIEGIIHSIIAQSRRAG